MIGHGWFDLEPHGWEADRFTTVIAAGRSAADIAVTQSGEELRATAKFASAPSRATSAAVRDRLRQILRLDVDLSEFWSVCEERGMDWVPAQAAGYLVRSATWFEDLLKLVFTTNCSWAATRLMCQRTAAALGVSAPSGRRAFPDAARCARQDESFWREEVRAGYRAKSCVRLAELFATGEATEADFLDPEVPTDEVRRRLLALPGFGPYAAGQALRLAGRGDDLALDSWCRARLTTLLGRRQPPKDAAIEKRYRDAGSWRGLVMWMELTEEWHREGADI